MALVEIPDGLARWVMRRAAAQRMSRDQFVVDSLTNARDTELQQHQAAWDMWALIRMGPARQSGVASISDLVTRSRQDARYVQDALRPLVELGFIQPIAGDGLFRVTP